VEGEEVGKGSEVMDGSEGSVATCVHWSVEGKKWRKGGSEVTDGSDRKKTRRKKVKGKSGRTKEAKEAKVKEGGGEREREWNSEWNIYIYIYIYICLYLYLYI
jgi:hypothetical protein